MKSIAFLGIACSIVFTAGSDWRQFRGTYSNGLASDASIPTQFDAQKNIAWKAALPGKGPSSPIVVGDRVFVTAAGGPRNDHLYVAAFDAASGRQVWQRTFWGTGPAAAHPKTSMAGPTPASDGKNIVALFATNDLVCLDLDGNVRWIRALYEENPGATDGRGLAASPLIVGNVVVVHIENQNASFAAGIDIESGANRWRIDRPREISWTSPISWAANPAGDMLALLQGSTHLTAVDPTSGKEVWNLKRASDPIASSVVQGDVLFVPGEKGLAAFEFQPDGKAPKQLWEEVKLNPVTSSPVWVGNRIYSMRNDILVNGDENTGHLRGQLRLKGAFSASLVAAGGLIYAVNESGVVHVIKPNDADGEIVARNELGEAVLATPAIADGAMYIRSDKHLWKIAESNAK
jgi:outer membrane protein assembly factor BamB